MEAFDSGFDDEPFQLERPVTVVEKPGFSLRPYQKEAVAALTHELGKSGKTLGILATGLGKTELAAELIATASERGALFITPREELVWQTAKRLRERGIPCGVEQGSNRSNEKNTVACYNSLLSRKRWEKYLGCVDLVIVDEVHTNFSKRSMDMLGNLTQGGVRLLGLTATPDRTSGDPLTTFYGNCGFYYGIKEATDDGWLCPSKVWLSVIEDMDLSRVRSSRFGDFNSDELNWVMEQERVVQGIASLVEQHHEGEPSIVFCQSIRQTEMLIDILARRGLRASMVHSEMDREERKMHLADFESGRIKIIANVSCLTMGWDYPPLKKMFMAKPTRSRAAYVQAYGRLTRCLAGTVDGLATPDERKSAIAASNKPYFECFDITDNSRHNDLCCSLDVLFPETDRQLMKRARAELSRARAGLTDHQKLMEKARAEERRELQAREKLEWHKRNGIVMDARIGNYARDAYQKAEEYFQSVKEWRMRFGKYEGKLLEDVPTGYLAWVRRESGMCRSTAPKSVAFTRALDAELRKRRKAK
jgi:superfamily II DNA or RNA helicase/uncharacterized protein (DUF3820 family)